jgi:hypothetical protein
VCKQISTMSLHATMYFVIHDPAIAFFVMDMESGRESANQDIRAVECNAFGVFAQRDESKVSTI